MNDSYYRHIDGGIYRFVCHAKHADNDEPHVVYEHLWPFDPETRVRRANEFFLRFTPISKDEVATALSEERGTAQTAVTDAKARRRNEEARQKAAKRQPCEDGNCGVYRSFQGGCTVCGAPCL